MTETIDVGALLRDFRKRNRHWKKHGRPPPGESMSEQRTVLKFHSGKPTMIDQGRIDAAMDRYRKLNAELTMHEDEAARLSALAKANNEKCWGLRSEIDAAEHELRESVLGNRPALERTESDEP